MSGELDPAQDLHAFVEAELREHPEDVLVVEERLGRDQVVVALAMELWSRGRAPMLLCKDVEGVGMPVIANVFASRARVARFLGTDEAGLHRSFVAGVERAVPPEVLESGPVLALRRERGFDLNELPMLGHFAQDAARYLTSAIVLADDPETGVGNASYHRCMVSTPTSLSTSLHSRGHLWRYLASARTRRELLPVAVVLGGHPLFMLAAAARVGIEVDELDIAGGLFGRPLQVVRTPRHGISVPATADIVLEGTIDPEAVAAEGPFGEYSGYASARSTNNVIEVSAILSRTDPMLVDVVSGNSPDHLNLGRIPRESEIATRIHERFPEVVGLAYPASGTHFHAYVALRPGGPGGQARQVLLALLGLDPYLKLAVAVDDDIDVRRDDQVLWAVATRLQADRDVFMVPGLPGSPLDPSSEVGTTARMGLDATAGPGFEAERITLSNAAVTRARELLDGEEPA